MVGPIESADKFGHAGASIARLIINEKPYERATYAIQEDLSEPQTPKDELLNVDKSEDYVSRRVQMLMREGYARTLKQLPFQVVTNYTLNARTDVFTDEPVFTPRKGRFGHDPVLNRRFLFLTGSSVDNSIELLYRKFKFGVSISSVLTRGTFGRSICSFSISRDISENVEMAVVANTGNFMAPNSLMLSVRKRFSDSFFGTMLMTFTNQLVPNLYAVFHKTINKRHSVELTVTNGLFFNYSYMRVLSRYTKLNLKVRRMPDTFGVELRTKTMNVFGSTLGALVRLCAINGVCFEWFFRTFVESNYLGVSKVEYRLRLSNSDVVLILKGIVNNSKVTVPILLYRGDNHRAVYLMSTLTVVSLLLPVAYTAVRNLCANARSRWLALNEDEGVLDRLTSIVTEDEEVYTNTLRDNFYLTFPQFFRSAYCRSPLGPCPGPPNAQLRHTKYYQYPPLSWDPRGDGRTDTDEEAERRIATEEKNKLQAVARASLLSELEAKGLVVLLAVYGHPRLAEYLHAHHRQLDLAGREFEEHPTSLPELLQADAELAELAESHATDVTAVLMSRVEKSKLYLSGSSKASLIGFYNPCATLKVEPKLVVV